METSANTFIYNGSQYVPFVEPSKAAKASHYLGKAVTTVTETASYIRGVVTPYIASATSKVAELQTAAAGQLPGAVTSTVGQEITIKGIGSATVGTVAALAGSTVLPIVNYVRKGLGRSFELSSLKAENQKVLTTALAQSGRNIDSAIKTIENQTAKINLMTRKHNQNAQDSFFSVKNMLKHTVTVLVPFCVLPQVGFAVAGTAALVGLTARAATHVLNYRGEASQVVAEQNSASSLRQLRNRLQEQKDTHQELKDTHQELKDTDAEKAVHEKEVEQRDNQLTKAVDLIKKKTNTICNAYQTEKRLTKERDQLALALEQAQNRIEDLEYQDAPEPLKNLQETNRKRKWLKPSLS